MPKARYGSKTGPSLDRLHVVFRQVQTLACEVGLLVKPAPMPCPIPRHLKRADRWPLGG
jgi:hypothetical protein